MVISEHIRHVCVYVYRLIVSFMLFCAFIGNEFLNMLCVWVHGIQVVNMNSYFGCWSFFCIWFNTFLPESGIGYKIALRWVPVESNKTRNLFETFQYICVAWNTSQNLLYYISVNLQYLPEIKIINWYEHPIHKKKIICILSTHLSCLNFNPPPTFCHPRRHQALACSLRVKSDYIISTASSPLPASNRVVCSNRISTFVSK